MSSCNFQDLQRPFSANLTGKESRLRSEGDIVTLDDLADERKSLWTEPGRLCVVRLFPIDLVDHILNSDWHRISLGRPRSVAQRVALALIDSGRADNIAGAATGHEPGVIGCTTATRIIGRAVGIFTVNVSKTEDMSDLVGECPDRRVLGNGSTQDVVRVGGASVQTRDRANKVGDNIQLSNIVTIVEELDLFVAQLVGAAIISDIQVSQGRYYVCSGKVLAAREHYTDACCAVNVLHACEHGEDRNGRVGPELDVQSEGKIMV